jgi:hypothetical protein
MDPSRFKQRPRYDVRPSAAQPAPLRSIDRPLVPAVPITGPVVQATPQMSAPSAPPAPKLAAPTPVWATPPTMPAPPPVVAPAITTEPANPILQPVPLPAVPPPSVAKAPHKLVAALAVVFVLVGVGGASVWLLQSHAGTNPDALYGAASVIQPTVSASVTKPLLPKGNSQLAKGVGLTHNAQRGTYGYVDSFLGSTITVNQQPVVASYTVAQVANALIKGSNQTAASFTTNHGLAYVLSAPGSNAQTVALISNHTLITIQSTATHTTQQWTDYINSLQ